MASVPLHKALESFTRLSATVYFRDGSKEDARGDLSAPKIILFFAWAGAPPRAVAKYLVEYAIIYPSTRIILFTTASTDLIWATASRWRKELSPALRLLDDVPDPKVLVHLFSNGGAYKFLEFLKVYRAIVNKQLQTTAIILDSAPGRGTFSRSVSAVSYELPKPPYLYYPSLFLLYVGMLLLFGFGALSRKRNTIEQMDLDLNDSKHVSKCTRKCYIYSDKDHLVYPEDVEANADQAKAKGYVVRRERFLQSPHVSHMRIDGERYWRIVRSFWGETGRGDEGFGDGCGRFVYASKGDVEERPILPRNGSATKIVPDTPLY